VTVTSDLWGIAAVDDRELWSWERPSGKWAKFKESFLLFLAPNIVENVVPPRSVEVTAGQHRIEVMPQGAGRTQVAVDFFAERGRSYRIELAKSEHSSEAMLVRDLVSERIVADTEPLLDDARTADLSSLALEARSWYRDAAYSLVSYDEGAGGEVLDQLYPPPDQGAVRELLPASVDLILHLRAKGGATEARILECIPQRSVVVWSGGKTPRAGISVLRSLPAGLHVLSYRRSGSALSEAELELWRGSLEGAPLFARTEATSR